MNETLSADSGDAFDLRIRTALDAQASTIQTLPPRRAPGGSDRWSARGYRWPYALVTAAAVVAVIVGIAIGFTMTRGASGPAPAAVTPTQSPAPAPTPSAATTAPSTTTAPSSGSTSPIIFGPGQLALWPFTSTRDELSWQSAYAASGADAWHLDADATAIKFATDYLGFTSMSAVTSRDTNATTLKIGIGFGAPGNATAAVITLRRSSSNGPWEVTGATSSTLSITSPAAGATVGSTMTVSGTITGVDENIKVSVHQQGTTPIGQSCCQPAGGTQTPWSTQVTLSNRQPGVAAIVASTGGHLEAVEKFAVQGVLVS